MTNKIKYIVIALIIAAVGLSIYGYNTLKSQKTDRYIDINNVTVDTNGKKLVVQDSTTKKIHQQTQRTGIKTDINYIPKESKADADVELKTTQPTLKLKVNNGPVHNFKLNPTEKYKMEDGKLVITQGMTSDINLVTNDYKRSKWSITTAVNNDKKVMGGINYDLGNCVSASVFIGQGIKPYYGLTYKIGSHN